MLEISTASLQHVQVTVAARAAGAAVNLSGDTVKMAFLAAGVAPVSGDWKTAQWDTDTTTTPPTYRAQCLVGPGGTAVLSAGDYVVWVQVNHSPELVALQAGPLRVV